MKLPQPVLSAITAVLIFQIVSKAAEPIPDALIWTVYPGTTTEQPNTFNSLEAAIHSLRQKKRESGGRLQQPIEVRVMPGEYFLDVPLTFKPEDSGTAECPVTFRAWGTGPVVISGGVPIEHWSRTEWNDRPALVADLPRMNGVPLNFQQLWINGRRATLARSPNQGYLKLERAIDPPEVDATSRTGTREFTYKEEDTRYWKDVNSGTAVVFNRWMENRMPLYAIYPTNRQVQCDRPSLWQLEADDSYYLEGGPSMLDTPGEWWPDIENDKLYYLPLPGETTVRGVAPALHQILRLEGRPREDRYVEHLAFQGFTFSHTIWPLPEETAGYRQAAIGVGAAIFAVGTRRCTWLDCEITEIGNYAIQLETGCHQNRILGCHLHDLGAGGILIGSDNRGRTFKTPADIGPYPPVLDHPVDASSENEVADCRIHDGGRYYQSAVGIWIGQSPANRIHHNEIYDFYYSGMSVGWTWGYGPGLAQENRITYNHIHHIGARTDGDGPVLSDMAGLYTLGDQTGTLIRHNVINTVRSAKYGGWGLYFDEGTRHAIAEFNLIYDTMHGCFNQHYGRENLVTNNILAFSDAGVVSLGRADPHLNFTLTRNLLVTDGGPLVFGGYGYQPGRDPAIYSDYNVVWNTRGRIIAGQDRQPSRFFEPDKPTVSWEDWQALGHDLNSIIIDPGFRDSANGDFSLKDPDVAREIGFLPFDPGEAGPRK